MRERPILYSGSMVRAILDGRKTRRKLYVRKGEDPSAPEHLARRLANGLDSANDGECWVWRRSDNGEGYGTLRVGGRTVLAHRLAYELAVGPIPAGLDLLHSCDNPPCINPAHLSPGTRSQNMRDCFQRGRANIPVPCLRGEANGAAKLSDAAVLSIRRLRDKGWTQRAIADRHGISQSQVSNIVRGRQRQAAL